MASGHVFYAPTEDNAKPEVFSSYSEAERYFVAKARDINAAYVRNGLDPRDGILVVHRHDKKCLHRWWTLAHPDLGVAGPEVFGAHGKAEVLCDGTWKAIIDPMKIAEARQLDESRAQQHKISEREKKRMQFAEMISALNEGAK